MEQGRFKYRNTTIVIHEGDISFVPADVLITAIDSSGMWFGEIDDAIKHSAGTMFHAQASVAMPLHDGQAVVARKSGSHNGMWEDVVFVVDDFEHPLSQIVRTALETASRNRYRSASLPAIRTGVTLGVVERNAKAAVDEILCGLYAFLKNNPQTSLCEIHFVICSNPEVLCLFMASDLMVA